MFRNKVYLLLRNNVYSILRNKVHVMLRDNACLRIEATERKRYRNPT